MRRRHHIYLDDTECRKCGTAGCLRVEATSATHDNNLIDLIVVCSIEGEDEGCGAKFNAFVSYPEMMLLEE